MLLKTLAIHPSGGVIREVFVLCVLCQHLKPPKSQKILRVLPLRVLSEKID